MPKLIERLYYSIRCIFLIFAGLFSTCPTFIPKLTVIKYLQIYTKSDIIENKTSNNPTSQNPHIKWEDTEYMMKIDATVRRESIYVAGWIVLLSVLMQAVFIIIGKWDYTVLCGNLLGGAASFANFLLLGITVQKAVAMEEKQAANAMKLSQTLRLLMIFIAAVLGAVLECFNIWATIIPIFFVRIAIAFRPLFGKKDSENKPDSEDKSDS